MRRPGRVWLGTALTAWCEDPRNPTPTQRLLGAMLDKSESASSINPLEPPGPSIESAAAGGASPAQGGGGEGPKEAISKER